MVYNETVDSRIRRIVSHWPNTDSRKMFGGVCHLLDGHMFCGVHKDELILRLGKEKADMALKLKNVKAFDITGKPMKGWIIVAGQGFKTDNELRDWLEQARDFAEALPPK
jgi:TfoX/Sxy family transcriptional regulator of competence genes